MSLFSRTDANRERWESLASIVQTGLDNFRRLGTALREIRDKELYKFEHPTFERCCERRWQITPQHAGRLIDAATLAELLEPTGYVPTSERQVRPLRGLEPAEQIAAWTEAQEEGGTTAAVERAAAKRKPRKSKKAPRPIKLRVPGAWVVITPNRKFSDVRTTLEHALHMLDADQQRDAA